MHDCSPYGHLVVNGKGILPTILARRVGTCVKVTERLLAELKEHGVYSVRPDGSIFSQRMIRDEHKRDVRAAGGYKSLENPNVPRRKIRVEDGTKDTLPPSPSSPSPSSPSSTSPSSDSTNPLFVRDFETVWALYPKRSGDNGKQKAYRAYVARRRLGVTASELLAGVERYAAYVEATSKVGTQFTKMAATFFGPDGNYLESWELPPPRANNGSQGHPLTKAVGSNLLAAVELIARVRKAATVHNTYSGTRGFPPGWESAFDTLELRVIKAIQTGRILNETNEGTLVSQVAKALGGAE
jgi:hypothetical protein